jgi:hypothetical protein
MAGCLAAVPCVFAPTRFRVTQLRFGRDARRGGSAMQGLVLFNCFFCVNACGVSSVGVRRHCKEVPGLRRPREGELVLAGKERDEAVALRQGS